MLDLPLLRIKIEQTVEIKWGTWPTITLGLPAMRFSIPATAHGSLELPISLSQGNCLPSMEGFQMPLYTWYPRTLLSIVNTCTGIFSASIKARELRNIFLTSLCID